MTAGLDLVNELVNPEQVKAELNQHLRENVLPVSLRPPPSLSVSEWADQYRYLSPETAAEPGRWHTDRAPYQKGIMDACSDPDIEIVTMMTAAQIGKTKIVENVVGYYIDQDPSPILVMLPTERLGETWSKDNLTPMIRDTPRLHGKIKESKSRSSANTLLHKQCEGGGHITIVGANAPSGLAMRPIRVVLADEIDRFPTSAGGEGDPLDLADKRTRNFPNRKKIRTSTPTERDMSRIEESYLASDRRRYYVPCPFCDRKQPLTWSQESDEQGDPLTGSIVWEKDATTGEHKPETAHYACMDCGSLIDETYKQWMLDNGVWIAENPDVEDHAGFHLNALYSPWVRWSELAKEFLEVRKNPERLRVFVNTGLAQSWDDPGHRPDAASLTSRRESYPTEVPHGVGVLTAAIDVQDDRLELLVVGWGAGQETWRIRHERIYGDPTGEEVWQRADVFLTRPYQTEYDGVTLRVRATCVDSGDQTTTVYAFVRPRESRRVWATKGISQPGRPLLTAPARKSKTTKVKLFTIGVDAAKDLLFSRLQITEPGPGYMHFCEASETGGDDEFLAQYGAEKRITQYKKGRRVREYRQVRRRNEAIDLEVLNMAALHTLGPAVTEHLDIWLKRLARRAVEAGNTTPELDDFGRPKSKTKKRGRRRRSSWVRG